MLLVLLLLSSSGLAQREGVVINRRARQRLPRRQQVIPEDPVLAPVQPVQTAFQGSDTNQYEWTPSQRARPVENVSPNSEPDYRQTALAAFNQHGFGSRQFLPQETPAQSGRAGDSVGLGENQALSGSNAYESDVQNRQSSSIDNYQYAEPRRVSSRRARLPRRRTQLTRGRDNTQTDYREQSDRDINNDEIRQQSQHSPAEQSSDRELRRGERAGTSIRAESRRLRTRMDKPVQAQDSVGQVTTPTRTRSRSRHRSRSRTLEVTTSGYEYATKQENRASRGRLRERPSNRISDTPSTRIDYNNNKKSTSKSSLSPKVHFPKKNLFPQLPKFSTPRDNQVDSGKSDFHRPTKSSIRSRGRFSQKEEIQPSQPLQRKDSHNDYQNIELQSGKQDVSELVPSVITVTHQVPTRTVFTIVESGETKSLFADTFESSLQIVDVSDLQSTEINSHRVVYAHVQTNHPKFGVKEYEYEALQPTRTYTIEERNLKIGGRRTSILDTIYTTIYNVEKITARITETPDISTINQGDPENVNQISNLLQNVILKLIGGGLLGNNLQLGGGGGPTIHGPPRTQFITHTRSFLTTTTTRETIVIPVNFRGSRIEQTVTDVKTLTTTTTDYSVQTLLNFEKPSDEPFFPFAPTLHRAARVVPTEPAAFSTSYVTHTLTDISTISTDITSEIIITLGGREIKTDITEPRTQVVTSTSLSTQSFLVQPSYHQQHHAVNQLQLIKALLRLKT
eukprot:GFUD01012073.1.p1 GENE.GFUD01012073.1~~GFUD01012073.1.p1  ORF type:complete len:736 (+),score=107.13 GFUD01012073.1:247-2454(+)